MEECLLNIGSVVKVAPDNDEQQEWIIIGRRIVSPKSLIAWDYVSVSTKGFQWTVSQDKSFSPYFFFFNHPDIEEVVHTTK